MDAVISHLANASTTPQPVPYLGHIVRELTWQASSGTWKLAGTFNRSNHEESTEEESSDFGEFDAVVSTSARLMQTGVPGQARVHADGAFQLHTGCSQGSHLLTAHWRMHCRGACIPLCCVVVQCV